MLSTINVQYLNGVGPKRVKKLNSLGIYTVEELLEYFPRKFEDRRKINKILFLKDKDKILLKIKIISQPSIIRLSRKRDILKVMGSDDTGSIEISWFNKSYFADKIKLNEYYYLFGSVKMNNNKVQIINPEIEIINEAKKAGRIIPIYSLTKGLTNNELYNITKNTIKKYKADIKNVLPDEIIKHYSLLDKKDAVEYMHFPLNGQTYKKAKDTIAFEKLLVLQMGLLTIKNRLKNSSVGTSFNNTSIADKFLMSLPFQLTNAQKKVIDEINEDMFINKPMNRLVQGDVGSGKTVVAISAMLNVVSSGYQAAMMAPTEILAEQHYKTITNYTKDLDIKVEFLSGSTKKREKKDIQVELKLGEIDILIGTHAIIEKDIVFNKIGLVVTDEQHRFGVRQRAMFSNKGNNPDILVLSATPIPRTLALMFYGDLNISVIDEMPPGRQIIKTYALGANRKEESYKFIIDKIIEGRQAYIVAPLIEESEKMELDSVVKVYDKLSKGYFKDYSINLLHGKMKSKEKEEIMNNFHDGNIDILISTTVIEVGVNVPNAVVMLILNAERFGLAQLHQLRGRVGRGKEQSYCILINESSSKKSKDRLDILSKTNSGFIIAQKDLEIRGPGEFFGIKQHGIPKYELTAIVDNLDIVEEVKSLSLDLLKNNPKLDGDKYSKLRNKVLNLFNNEEIIFN